MIRYKNLQYSNLVHAHKPKPNLSKISGDIEIDDVTCGTKSTTTQDVLDTSYAAKGLIVHTFLNPNAS